MNEFDRRVSEILFRGKSLETGQWVEGHVYTQVFLPDSLDEEWHWYVKPVGSDICGEVQVAPFTVGQYTGCRDRNGRHIFEGDILAFDPGEGEETSYYLVRWGDAKWILSYEDGREDDDMTDWESKNWTVVGNIHDDPGLMRGAK